MVVIIIIICSPLRMSPKCCRTESIALACILSSYKGHNKLHIHTTCACTELNSGGNIVITLSTSSPLQHSMHTQMCSRADYGVIGKQK